MYRAMWYNNSHKVGVRRTGSSRQQVFSFGHHGRSKNRLMTIAKTAIGQMQAGTLTLDEAKDWCLAQANAQ